MADPSPKSSTNAASGEDTAVKNNDIKYELIAEAGTEHTSEPPLKLLRRALRGKYGFVVIISTLLAVIGAIVGYTAAPPVYESTGIVRIEGSRPIILYESEENRVPRMYDAYVALQMTYMRSRQVLDATVDRPEMRNAGWPAGDAGVAALQKSLVVKRGVGEQVVSVTISASDPFRAQVAVNSLLSSFQENCVDRDGLSFDEKENTLTIREQSLERGIQQLRSQMLEVTDQYGAEAIERMHAAKVEEIRISVNKLAGLQIARTKLELGAVNNSGDLTPLGITADSGSKLSNLAEQEMALVAELRSLGGKYGPKHPMICELNRKIEAVRIEIDLRDRALADITTDSTGTIGPASPDHAAIIAASNRRLDNLEAQYSSMRDGIRDEAASLGRQRVAVASLAEQETEIKERLAETRKRLDQLQVEGSRNDLDRVTIAAAADFPVAPVRDRRRGLAAASALFGAVFGVGLVFLCSVLDPRIRYIEDLEVIEEINAIIGTLPDLTTGDRKNERWAARGVHQLRNLLELQFGDPNKNVHAVSSCDRGEGKTSLTLALGASFAAAGRKTLVVDADIANSSLTRETGLTSMPGLCEAIGPHNEGGQVHQTRQENLWVMPIGSADNIDSEDLSRNQLIWLLDALRNRFDAILIDTGPILNSIEACLVAAVADRAVLVVGRSQSATKIRATLARLEQVGAKCAGIVFNRADSTDFHNLETTSARKPTNVASLVPGSPLGERGQGGPLTLAVNNHVRSESATQERKRAA